MRQSYARFVLQEGMARFAAVDRSLATSIQDLHDHLWHAPRKDEAALLRRIEAGASGLDQYLGARGSILRAVRPITRNFVKVPAGADLFTFLTVVANLAGAAETRRRKPKDAAKRCTETVVSLAIHLASVSDSFDLVEDFESGKTDFLDFTTGLADVLEERGVVRAGEFKRVANSVYDIHALWEDRASRDQDEVAVVAAIGSTSFAAVLFLEALRDLGRYRDLPYSRLVPAMRKILDRLGAHP